MNDGDVQAVLDRLVPPFDGEDGDWHEVVRRSATPLQLVTRRRARPRSALIAAAAVVLAAVAALAITAPWRGGPTVLERAAAAISAPKGSSVLYEDVVVKWLAPRGNRGTTKLELWFGSTRFRVRTVHDGQSSDVGGRVGKLTGLLYSSASGDVVPVAFPAPVARTSLDPAVFIKSALASGRAHVAGQVSIAGRTAIRIVFGAHGLAPTATYFADARTYAPVRISVRAVVPNASPPSVPLADALELPYGYFPRMGEPLRGKRYLFVYDFKAFRYLPFTAANVKLTSVRAQHPGAKVA